MLRIRPLNPHGDERGNAGRLEPSGPWDACYDSKQPEILKVPMMISGRSLEAATALLTGAFGAAVVVSSLDNGIGWSAAGVDSGTFPFIFRLVIFGGRVFNLLQGR